MVGVRSLGQNEGVALAVFGNIVDGIDSVTWRCAMRESVRVPRW